MIGGAAQGRLGPSLQHIPVNIGEPAMPGPVPPEIHNATQFFILSGKRTADVDGGIRADVGQRDFLASHAVSTRRLNKGCCDDSAGEDRAQLGNMAKSKKRRPPQRLSLSSVAADSATCPLGHATSADNCRSKGRLPGRRGSCPRRSIRPVVPSRVRDAF